LTALTHFPRNQQIRSDSVSLPAAVESPFLLLTMLARVAAAANQMQGNSLYVAYLF
jgi:hypothetical protein